MAVEYDGGVVLGADSRTTTGSYIVNRVTDKLTPITEKIFCCRSGSAADTQAIADSVKYELNLLCMELQKPPLVETAANLFRSSCYQKRDSAIAGIIVAGWDYMNGGQVFTVPLGGMCIRQPFSIGGSGSTYIYGHCDATYKQNMTKEECYKFVANAVALAMFRDGSSGGVIRMAAINKDGVERKVLVGLLMVMGQKYTFFFAAKEGRASDLLWILSQKNASPNLREGESQTTALHMTCSRGHTKCTEILIKSGAHVNVRTAEGMTPLHFAAYNGHIGCMQILLKANANVHATTRFGCTALHQAAFFSRLQCAELIINCGGGIDTQENWGLTPLSVAAQKGDSKMLILLLAKNASTSIHEKLDGKTSLQISIENNHPDCAAALLDGGADPNARDLKGRTALHYALAGSDAERLVRLLLEYGADPSIKNTEHKSPLEILSLQSRDRRLTPEAKERLQKFVTGHSVNSISTTQVSKNLQDALGNNEAKVHKDKKTGEDILGRDGEFDDKKDFAPDESPVPMTETEAKVEKRQEDKEEFHVLLQLVNAEADSKFAKNFYHCIKSILSRTKLDLNFHLTVDSPSIEIAENIFEEVRSELKLNKTPNTSFYMVDELNQHIHPYTKSLQVFSFFNILMFINN
eukprot:gene15336-16913_t